MGEYSIKDLEKLSGIKAHTIRIWEKRYDIITPGRTDTNRRRYTDEDLRKLINISILTRSGFKISMIASMSPHDIEDKVSIISQDIEQYDNQIESLIIAMINLSERDFNDLINRYFINMGFEDTFSNILFPFLERVGVLWVTGSISPAQEHFISNLVRQKLISTIDSLIPRKINNKLKVLLFLPENELHEIGLLFYTYLAKKNGHETLYLGPKTPIDSIAKAIKIWPADILVTGTSSEFSGVVKEELIERLSKSFKNHKIIISGLLIPDSGVKLPGNVHSAKTADEFVQLIKN